MDGIHSQLRAALLARASLGLGGARTRFARARSSLVRFFDSSFSTRFYAMNSRPSEKLLVQRRSRRARTSSRTELGRAGRGGGARRRPQRVAGEARTGQQPKKGQKQPVVRRLSTDFHSPNQRRPYKRKPSTPRRQGSAGNSFAPPCSDAGQVNLVSLSW